jgi:hypothetical protein
LHCLKWHKGMQVRQVVSSKNSNIMYQILAATNWALKLQTTDKLLKAQLAYRVVHVHVMLKKRTSWITNTWELTGVLGGTNILVGWDWYGMLYP